MRRVTFLNIQNFLIFFEKIIDKNIFLFVHSLKYFFIVVNLKLAIQK